MSHYMTALAMKQQGLKPATKIVLYWLADHHNGETLKCYPSIKRLAKVCEMSEQSVRNQLKELERLGLIQFTPYFCDDGRQTSNNYYLMLKDDGTVGGLEKYDRASRNLRGEGTNSVGGRVQNFDPNLVRNNLGNEPCILFGSIEELDDDFNAFWAAYPRKVGKALCRKVYVRALAKIKADELLEKTHAFAASCSGKEVKFIPHPSTWLNQERWNDTLSTETINVQNDVLKSMGLSYD